MKWYTFCCEGIDNYGYSTAITQKFADETEEQARREVIHLVNGMFGFYPRKLTLLESKDYEVSPFDFV